MIYGLDLFSGIGGISIALDPWVKTITYCEQDRFAQSVLLSRMAEGKLHKAPIWDDVQTLTGKMLPAVDIISGGFPCQDISVAGAGKGLEGKRSGLFFEIIRLTQETGAPFVFLENVPAIRTRGLRQVIGAFTEIGYDCRWTCLSAASVGALHKRERWFLLAHANSHRSKSDLSLQTRDKRESVFIGGNGQKESLADSMREGLERQPKTEISGSKRQKQISTSIIFDRQWWSIEPDVGRVVNGLPDRAHRIKCLGNSVVPMQVREAFKKLMGLY